LKRMKNGISKDETSLLWENNDLMGRMVSIWPAWDDRRPCCVIRRVGCKAVLNVGEQLRNANQHKI
jgi:hypothetical protein